MKKNEYEEVQVILEMNKEMKIMHNEPKVHSALLFIDGQRMPELLNIFSIKIHILDFVISFLHFFMILFLEKALSNQFSISK